MDEQINNKNINLGYLTNLTISICVSTELLNLIFTKIINMNHQGI